MHDDFLIGIPPRKRRGSYGCEIHLGGGKFNQATDYVNTKCTKQILSGLHGPKQKKECAHVDKVFRKCGETRTSGMNRGTHRMLPHAEFSLHLLSRQVETPLRGFLGSVGELLSFFFFSFDSFMSYNVITEFVGTLSA